MPRLAGDDVTDGDVAVAGDDSVGDGEEVGDADSVGERVGVVDGDVPVGERVVGGDRLAAAGGVVSSELGTADRSSPCEGVGWRQMSNAMTTTLNTMSAPSAAYGSAECLDVPEPVTRGHDGVFRIEPLSGTS
jgi:hypothetical protein